MTRFLPAYFLRRLAAFAIVVLAATDAQAQSRTIVLDAGHGGHDRGGVPGQRVAEKTLTLDVTQRLRKILQSRGYRVIMTRETDDFISLPRRVAIANSYRGATFVSVHFNSASRAGANGIETYYYRGDSVGLAASIHRNVVAAAPTENRGIRRRGYFVLRRTSIPGVLVECGFLTNPTEARYCSNPTYRQKLAEQIARGIQRQPAQTSRPLSPASAVSSQVLAHAVSGPDFVRPAPRSSRRSFKHYKSSRSGKKASSSKKKSSSSKKKSSSSKKKKSSGS